MQTFTLTLTYEQLQKLGALVDAGVRYSGLAAARDAADVKDLLETAKPVEEPKTND